MLFITQKTQISLLDITPITVIKLHRTPKSIEADPSTTKLIEADRSSIEADRILIEVDRIFIFSPLRLLLRLAEINEFNQLIDYD